MLSQNCRGWPLAMETWQSSVLCPGPEPQHPTPPSASHPSDSVVPFISVGFSLVPTGTCPESVAGPHRAGRPRALLREATLSAMATQRAQLLRCEPGKCAPILGVCFLQSWRYVELRCCCWLQLEQQHCRDMHAQAFLDSPGCLCTIPLKGPC